PLGGRLLCALDGVGLEIVDPAADYAPAALRAFSGKLGHLAATERFALIETTGGIIPVAIHGDDLNPAAALAIAGSVRAIERRGDVLLVATSQGLYQVTETSSVTQLASGAVRALSQLPRQVLAASDAGELLVI